ncbi:ABC transporter permease [Yinghuangia seranimata]|uniref:ABC transporter permease n=1 Tax=Yinghuangia seranimata TaxID=408067 RepID=UPI00248D0AD0|nr:ABC transporter permease [Yinghuangia seranimata]MDI2132044.1 ABC transporter permease [Yinghuangia seranimata]
MLRFLVRRLLGAALILFIVVTATFFLFFAIPDDPARLSCGKTCTPETLHAIRANLGLDESVPMQYWHYLTGIFAGRDFGDTHCEAPCLGYSFVNHEPVLDTLMDRFPTTLSLAFGASVIFMVVGVGAGIFAALNRGRWLDKATMALSLVAASVTIQFLGVIARYVLVDELRWLPPPKYVPFFDNSADWAGGLLLPWFTLALVQGAVYTRLTRSSMVDTLSEDYVRTVRAKGLRSRDVYVKHAWRGAMTPVLTVYGIELGVLLGGAVVTETTFNLPGIGKLAITSVANSDLPMIMGVVLIAATAMVLANVAVDALYAVIDPRVRIS